MIKAAARMRHDRHARFLLRFLQPESRLQHLAQSCLL